MKGLKLSLVVLTATLLAIGLGGVAYAFHSGGVAECAGCHSMHSPYVAAGATSGSYLLKNADQSSTCLSCHEHALDTGPSSYHISTPASEVSTTLNPKQRTPGGDFGWLRKNFTFKDEDGVTDVTELGQTHGHNIVAIENGYDADGENTVAPGGGSFPAEDLACTSCHNPHGQYRRLVGAPNTVVTTGAPIRASGSYNGTSNEPDAAGAVGVYRLLWGAATTGAGAVTPPVSFPGVPVAKAPSTYNQSEATNQVKVAYGVGSSGGNTTWGQWCATCHPNMHSTGNYVHPVDHGMSATVAGNYNAYKKSGDLSGVVASSYLSLVPFAKNTGVYSALATDAGNASPTYGGPAAGDQVTCLSCHRAHASGWEYALRWYGEYEFMTKDSKYMASDNGTTSATSTRAGVQHRGRLEADAIAAYYDRPAASVFATYQRVLCNKCHAKD